MEIHNYDGVQVWKTSLYHNFVVSVQMVISRDHGVDYHLPWRNYNYNDKLLPRPRNWASPLITHTFNRFGKRSLS